jgi:hypothetical protein
MAAALLTFAGVLPAGDGNHQACWVSVGVQRKTQVFDMVGCHMRGAGGLGLLVERMGQHAA